MGMSENDLKLEVATLIKTATKFQNDSDMYKDLFWEEVKKNPQWHPIHTEKDLPTQDGDYICTNSDNKVDVYIWEDGEWTYDLMQIEEKIIAWMELPQPYKEEL